MDLNVKIGKLELKNPVILASGTAGFGIEVKDIIDINRLGGIVTKTITVDKRAGSPPPRVVETPSGMLNSIGLDNEGLRDFIFNKVSFLRKLKTRIIISISGNTVRDFVKLVTALSKIPSVCAIEANLSCPNVKKVHTPILAQDRNLVEDIIAKLRRATDRTLIAKLSPNVTDIKEIAKAAERGGADAISLINTYPAMLVDIDTMKPRLGNVTGGLSGPAIKPIALKCVWDAYNAVKIPIIGIGGIMNAADAIEFILCGASAVQIGTANFVNPKAPLEIIEGIREYLKKRRMKSVMNLTGRAQSQ